MDLSIVIPQYNTWQVTNQLLENLNETMSNLYETEILLVDDGSTNYNEWSFTATHWPMKTIMRLENGGFSAAVNTGIEESTSNFIAVFNNDIKVSYWWDDVLIRTLNQFSVPRGEKYLWGKKVGMVSGALVESEEKRLSLDPEDIAEVQPIVLWEKGGPWLFKRRVFDEVGYFDEQFYPGNWEEIDLFLRMAIKGWVHGTVSNAMCTHLKHATLATQWTEAEFWRLYDVNKKRFGAKWGNDNPKPNCYEQAIKHGEWGK
jgi:GT2 family glycosyltransferase